MKISHQGTHHTRPFTALFYLLAGIASLYLSACSTPKNITYFKDVPDTIRQKMVEQATYYTPTIQPDDILQVTVQTLDPNATEMLNPQGSAAGAISGNAPNSSAAAAISGYLVDKDGYVVLPLLGKVLVKGKTTDQVRDEVRSKAAEYYKDPIVNVRFANFKITILGEVTRPATYVMPNEKVTLLDALGAAGDLTIFGKRENVLLIRDKEGRKEFVRLNLNDSKLFASSYYYLHQGDVIYVEPSKSKVISTDMSRLRNITIFTSIVTLAVVILSRIRF